MKDLIKQGHKAARFRCISSVNSNGKISSSSPSSQILWLWRAGCVPAREKREMLTSFLSSFRDVENENGSFGSFALIFTIKKFYLQFGSYKNISDFQQSVWKRFET